MLAMWNSSLSWIHLLALLCITSSYAGEILIYPRTSCSPDGNYYTLFSADVSTGCIKSPFEVLGDPTIYGATSGRNIGNHCSFALYSDAKCTHLVTRIASQGPETKRCIPIAAGLRSYKITCTPNSAGGAVLKIPNEQDFLDAGGHQYFQPGVTYRGKPSGNASTESPFPVVGDTTAFKPKGNAATIGTQLAYQAFAKVPTTGPHFLTSLVNSGTRYQLEIDASKNNHISAQKLLATVGPSSFASMMADVVASLQIYPRGSARFDVWENDGTGAVLGLTNVSYTAA